METRLLFKKISNYLFSFTLLLFLLMLTYCVDEKKESNKKRLEDFKAYVHEHTEAADQYLDSKWEELDSVYQVKKAAVDSDIDKLDQEKKDSYQKAVADWESFKEDLREKQELRAQNSRFEKMKTTLVPDDINTDLSNVTSDNIAGVYTHFYKTVDANKDNYSKEEWAQINNFWINLGYHKEKIDKIKAISEKDNKTINNIRLRYTAIKALNKPFADSETEK